MRLLFLFLILLLSSKLLASPDSLKIEGNDDPSKESTITLGGDFSSNTNTFGQFNNFVRQPLYSPYISFYGKKGLVCNALLNFVGNSDSTNTKTTTEFDFQIGYRWDITPWLSIFPSYTHFMYSANSGTLKSAFSDFFQIDMTAEVAWWYTTLSAGYIMGESNQFMFTPQTGINLQFDDFPFKNHTIAIQPSVSFDLTNQEYISEYYSKEYYFFIPYLLRAPEASIGDFLLDYRMDFKDFNPYATLRLNEVYDPYFTNRPKALKRIEQLPLNTRISSLIYPQTSSSKFTLTSLGVTLPVYYNINNFSLSYTFSAYKPLNQPDYMDSSWVFYSSFGLSYTFGL